MEREILFKGKRTDNGAWVKGYLIAENVIKTYEKITDEEGFEEYEDIDHMVDPKTISQFTGLLDKNGNKIWENDILTAYYYLFKDNGKPNYVGVVTFFEDCAQFGIILHCVNKEKRGISNGINQEITEDDKFEIIGNKFDNPELLGE